MFQYLCKWNSFVYYLIHILVLIICVKIMQALQFFIWLYDGLVRTFKVNVRAYHLIHILLPIICVKKIKTLQFFISFITNLFAISRLMRSSF